MLPHFQPGQTIVIRELWRGKLLRATPVIAVRDTPELIALYAPLHTVMKYPRTSAGERVKPKNRISGDWTLTDFPGDQFSALRLIIPGSSYSVILFRDPDFSVHH